MIKIKIILTGLIILFICKTSSGQDLSKIKITKSYSDYLDVVLLDIGTKYNVKFSYDWYEIHQYKLTENFNNTSLDSILNIMCDHFNLKYYNDEGYIKIEKQKEKTEGEIEEIGEIEEMKSYKGAPKNFNFTLSGKVIDKHTGESLPFAYVIAKENKIGTVTNADGYFTLLKVPTDTSTILVSYLGYKIKKVFLTPEIPKTNIIIEMIPSRRTLDEVVVVGEKEELLKVPEEISIVKISPKKLESLPNIGEKDIMRSLQLMPGISSSNESSSGLYVRGGTPDQNLILYDGFTVYHVDHLYGFYSAFNSNAIKDVQLHKGGFESKFGGRLSSVTEIIGKEGNQKNFNMGGEISLLSFNGFVETPIGKKISLMVAGRKSYKGFLYDKIFAKFNKKSTTTTQNIGGQGGRGGSDLTTTVSSYFYDLNSKVTYKPTNKDIISLSFYNGTDKLDNSRDMSTPSVLQNKGISMNGSTTDLTKFGNIGSSLKWSRKWGERLYGNTLISFSNYYNNRDRSDDMTSTNSSNETTTRKMGTLENNNLKDYSFKNDYQYDIFKGNQLDFGGFATYNDIAYTYSQNDTSTIINRHNYGVISGVYLQDKMQLFKSKLVLLPGIRYTFYTPTKITYTEPRFSITYDLTNKIKLKAAAGKYYQFINKVTREDIMAGNRDMWILSDNNKVPVSSAIHYIVGTSYETKNYLFDVEAYYKDLKGLTEYTLRINPKPDNSINYNENFFNGTSIAKGIEFMVQKKSGKLNGWICYTLGQVMNNFPVYSENPYPAIQDARHEFKIVSMYKYKRWEFACTWIYATGRPYTAPEGGYQLTLLDGTTKNYINVGDKNTLRLPDYHRLDVSVNLHFRNAKDNDIGYLGFSIFNFYNRTNVWYKEYQIVENNLVSTNVNYLGFTPNLTLSLKIR